MYMDNLNLAVPFAFLTVWMLSILSVIYWKLAFQACLKPSTESGAECML